MMVGWGVKVGRPACVVAYGVSCMKTRRREKKDSKYGLRTSSEDAAISERWLGGFGNSAMFWMMAMGRGVVGVSVLFNPAQN